RGTSLASLLRYVWPLLFVVIVLIGAMLITHDMGPLLIAAYAAGAFVAASVAMWLYQRFGTIGSAYALAVALFVAWILATTAGLFRSHARATRGEPRLVRIAGRMSNDHQAFVSWLCVAWVVLALCQLAVTVAGNLAVIPLTGVTFPFVSFGMTSLVVNMAMLGL